MDKICQLRRDISFVLVSILIAFFFFLSPAQDVYAAGDSNAMVQAYIGLMSGQKAVNIQNIESLTYDDLRCVALYLSNYYVPFQTSLDGEARDDTVESMVNCLTRDLGLAHETAEKLVDATLQASLSSAKQLYFDPAYGLASTSLAASAKQAEKSANAILDALNSSLSGGTLTTGFLGGLEDVLSSGLNALANSAVGRWFRGLFGSSDDIDIDIRQSLASDIGNLTRDYVNVLYWGYCNPTRGLVLDDTDGVIGKFSSAIVSAGRWATNQQSNESQTSGSITDFRDYLTNAYGTITDEQWNKIADNVVDPATALKELSGNMDTVISKLEEQGITGIDDSFSKEDIVVSVYSAIYGAYKKSGFDIAKAVESGFVPLTVLTEGKPISGTSLQNTVAQDFSRQEAERTPHDFSGYIGAGKDANDPGIFLDSDGDSNSSASVGTLGGMFSDAHGNYIPVSNFTFCSIFNKFYADQNVSWSSLIGQNALISLTNVVIPGAGAIAAAANTVYKITEGSKESYPVIGFYEDNGAAIPCFEWNSFTALMMIYFCEWSDAHETGKMGNYIITTSVEDWLARPSSVQESLTSVTQAVYVDWVGNIIGDIGTERVILYPACLNPYTFSYLDDDTSNPQNTPLHQTFNLNSVLGHKMYAYFNGSDSSDYYIDANGVFHWATTGIEYDFTLTRGQRLSGQMWDNGFGFWSDGTRGDLASALTSDSGSYGMSLGVDDSAESSKILAIGSDEEKSHFKDYYGDSDGIPVIRDYAVYVNDITTKEAAHILDGDRLQVMGDEAGESGSETWNLAEKTQKWRTGNTDFSNYMQLDASDTQYMKNIFLSYVFAYNNREQDSSFEGHYVNFKFNSKNFPGSLDDSIVWDDVGADAEKVTSFVYYLLHPTEGAAYVATMLKNKISGFFVGWHEDIVGATDSNSTTGMTHYLGVSSYVTTPSLTSLEWMAKLVDWYNNIIVYLIILMCLILFCYIITGYITVGRGVIGLVLFAVLAFVPPVAINMVADYSNRITDTIYSDKFDYWTYAQHQTYLTSLDQLSETTSLDNALNNYISTLQTLNEDLHGAESGTGEIGFSGVRLKWMCPKKVHENQDLENELDNALSYTDFSGLFVSLVTSATVWDDTQDFTESVGQTYLYRDFFDIYRQAAVGYNLLEEYDEGHIQDADWEDYYGGNMHSYAGDITYSSGKDLHAFVRSNTSDNALTCPVYLNETSALTAQARGFIPMTCEASTASQSGYDYIKESKYAIEKLLGYSGTVVEIHNNLESLRNVLNNSSSNTVAISADNLAAQNSNIIWGCTPAKFATYGINEMIMAGAGESDAPMMKDIGDFYYALYSESPYYYFNFAFRDYIQGGQKFGYKYDADNLSGQSGHVGSALVDNNQDFFFNLTENSGNGYGELRDFMNMHDLFYYIIPALDEGNQLADLFNDRFGMFVHSDCSLQVTSTGDVIYDDYTGSSLYDVLNQPARESAGAGSFGSTYGSGTVKVKDTLTDEEVYKLWHDYNVWLIFQTYVPWLDTMEDCEYAKPETIEVLGEKFLVANPLDPTSYFETDGNDITAGRYMVFSRSEMAYYGLDITDLTLVEQKIIECQDNVYKQALDLMNYYTLSDEVLINAFSIIETFEFNKIFSETNPLGSSYILYPQGYEARAFSYDAYLRLIISEASGEPLQVDVEEGSDGAGTSIYRRVLSKTSLFFGIFLLINDVLAVYVIPVLKLTVLVLLFFVSVALIIGASIKLELNIIDVCWKSIFAPLISYFLISIGFSWIVSLFMSNGASQVVKTSQTISLGDPTMAILMMIAINVTLTILYWKIFKKCFKDLKTYITSIASSIASTAVGAFKKIANTVMNGNDGMRRVRKSIQRASENGMPGGVPSTAKQRGRANGLGALGAAAAGALGGMAASRAMGALDNNDAEALRHSSSRDQKAYNRYARKAEKAEAKATRRQNKIEGREAAGGSKTWLGKKRDSASKFLQQRASNRAEAAKTKAQLTANYGRGAAHKYARSQMASSLNNARATFMSGAGKAMSRVAGTSGSAGGVSPVSRQSGLRGMVAKGGASLQTRASSARNSQREQNRQTMRKNMSTALQNKRIDRQRNIARENARNGLGGTYIENQHNSWQQYNTLINHQESNLDVKVGIVNTGRSDGNYDRIGATPTPVLDVHGEEVQ